MRSRQGGEFETYHLTCPVCGALPGTSCIEDYRELEQIHPSRRMSVAERNRRHAASGWEPPELAERRLRERDAEAASAPPPGPGTGVGAGLGGRRPRVTGPQPRRGPGSVWGLIWVAAGSSGEDGAAEAGPGTVDLGAAVDARGWLAAYLGGFPRNAAVPRWELRNIASARWHDTENRPLPLRHAGQQRRMEGRSGSSKGRRSSQKLADHLRSLEELGLIRRDSARDAVIVIDPFGLRGLADAPARPLHRADSGPGGDGR